MTDAEKRTAATKFYNDWRGEGMRKVIAKDFGLNFLGMF